MPFLYLLVVPVLNLAQAGLPRDPDQFRRIPERFGSDLFHQQLFMPSCDNGSPFVRGRRYRNKNENSLISTCRSAKIGRFFVHPLYNQSGFRLVRSSLTMQPGERKLF
jgi:hypothetical protein